MKKNIIIGMLALMAMSCQSKKEAETAEVLVVEAKKTEVKVNTLAVDTIEILEEQTATVNPYDKVFLAPTMPGRIKDIMVEVNDDVKKGQLVVKMDESQLTQLYVQFENLKKEMKRMEALKVTQSVSEQQYDQTKAQYDAMVMNVDNIEENTRLEAPFSGVVTGRFYDDNELYGGAPNTPEGKAAIVTIEEIKRLKVMVSMSERYFPKVQEGMTTTLTSDIYPNEEFEGMVSLVYPTINPATRTFMVEITIPNEDLRLRPGMYAKVAVKLGEKSALMVPSAAVLMQEGTNNRFIYVVENNIVKRISITVGQRFDDRLEVISSQLKVGMKYITSGQAKVDDGDEIVIVK